AIDYESMFKEGFGGTEIDIAPAIPLPADLLDPPNIAAISRYRLRRHFSVRSHWDYPGFYLGNGSDLDDLVAFWNLRAADISLLFVDRTHAERYVLNIPAWKSDIVEVLSHQRDRTDQTYAVWLHSKNANDAGNAALRDVFGEERCT